MFQSIAQTFINRIVLLISGFIIVVITAKYFGAEGRGIISLFMLALTILNAVSFIGSGPALTYLQPRLGNSALLIPAYIWVLASSLLVSLILFYSDLLQDRYVMDLMLLGFLYGCFSVNQNLILGQEKIRLYNLLQSAQAIFLLLSLLTFVLFLKQHDVTFYFYSLYISYSLSLLLSLPHLIADFKLVAIDKIKIHGTELFRNGFQMQSGAIIQSFNYRVAYFFLDSWVGVAAVGVFSTAIAIVEALWTVSRSIALVLFARIANLDSETIAYNETKKYAMYGLLLSFLLWFISVCLPASIYEYIFGPSFNEIPDLLLIMGPGVILFGYVYMVSHYFSGRGLHTRNIIASGFGLVVCLISSGLLIKSFHEIGASTAAMLSFVTTSAVLLFFFFRASKA